MCIPPAVEPRRGLIPQIATLDEVRGITATTVVRPGCHHGNRAKLITSSSGLALAELESLAGALLPVLLALLDARVAGEQTFALQRLAQLDVELEQSAGDAHLHRIGLGADAAAGDVGEDVEVREHLDQHQRPLCGDALLRSDKVLFKALVIDG